MTHHNDSRSEVQESHSIAIMHKCQHADPRRSEQKYSQVLVYKTDNDHNVSDSASRI